MLVNPINNGVVLDHIKAGNAMTIYEDLKLGELDCQVAIIKNCTSKKMGKKDILKINEMIDINFDILGYIDPGITVNIIRDGKKVEKVRLELPKRIENVIKCKNPRCITSVEQELAHIFELTDKKNSVYRCIYCESKAK